MATTIPAHLAVLAHPDFIEVRHSTTWLSDRVDLSGIAPRGHRPGAAEAGHERKDVEVEVDGRRFAVSVWVPRHGSRGRAHPAQAGPGYGGGCTAAPAHGPTPRRGRPARSGQVTVPMQGTVVKVLVKPGDTIEAGQTVCVLEAMKMENNIVSQFAGTVLEVRVGAGELGRHRRRRRGRRAGRADG